MNYYCEKCDEFIGDDGKDCGLRNPPSEADGLCSNCQDMEDIKEQKAKLEPYLAIHDELRDLCAEWIDAFPMTGGDAYDITINVNNEAYPPYVIANYTYRLYGGCDGDREYDGQEKIPLSIFWDYECIAKERKKRMDKQLEQLKKNEKKKKVQDLKDRATRYEQWLTLSEEFDDEKD